MKKLELGTIFKRNDEIYEVISIAEDSTVIFSRPVGKPHCEHCGNRFVEGDVEEAPGFQDSIKPVKTI